MFTSGGQKSQNSSQAQFYVNNNFNQQGREVDLISPHKILFIKAVIHCIEINSLDLKGDHHIRYVVNLVM